MSDGADAPPGPPRRRVTMVLQSFPPVLGGAQLQVQQLAPLLAARGTAVTVVTRRPPGTPDRERTPWLDLRRIACPRGRAAASLTFTAAGARATRASRPDVVHAHDLLSPSTTAVLARRTTRAPVVAKVLSSGPEGDVARLLAGPLGARRLALLGREVARFVCPSADTARDLVEHGIPPQRIARIPNGVDARRFRPDPDGHRRAELRTLLGVPEDAILAVYCGRLATAKRIEALLDAFRDGDGHLIIAGDGVLEDAVYDAATSDGLRGRLHPLGRVDDTAPLYRGADVFVTASAQDGLSNAALEAMASGLPVVTPRAGGMAELVRDGTGLLLDAGEPEEIARAVRVLARDRDRRRRMGECARRRVVEDFALAATADRLTALYDEVLEEAAR